MSEKDQKDSGKGFDDKKKMLDEESNTFENQGMYLYEKPEDNGPEIFNFESTEERKRRSAERLQKLRKISFNLDAQDPNSDLENIPAYIRRNMELHGSNKPPESSINEFLEGKKPDLAYGGGEYFPLENYLSLYFSLGEHDEEEIIEIIFLLSDLYQSVGGDELEIKSIKTFEFANQLTPELV